MRVVFCVCSQRRLQGKAASVHRDRRDERIHKRQEIAGIADDTPRMDERTRYSFDEIGILTFMDRDKMVVH